VFLSIQGLGDVAVCLLGGDGCGSVSFGGGDMAVCLLGVGDVEVCFLRVADVVVSFGGMVPNISRNTSDSNIKLPS